MIAIIILTVISYNIEHSNINTDNNSRNINIDSINNANADNNTGPREETEGDDGPGGPVKRTETITQQ